MRWRVGQLSRIALLAGCLVAGLPGCSSSDQQEGVDEAVSEDGYGEEGNNYADEGGDEEGYDNYADEGNEDSDNGNYGDEEEGYDNSYAEEGEYEEENGDYGDEYDDEEYVDEGNDVENALAEAGIDESLPSLEEVSNESAEALPAEIANAEAAPVTSAPVVASGPAGAIPEIGSKLPYVVRVGETLAKISQKIYGDANQWQEIAELTALDNANRIRPGDVVYYRLSEQTLAFATAYEGTPRESITVQPGDSLSKIAQRVYGNSSEWKYVWRQNDISNPDRLEVGQEVVYLSPVALAQAYNALKDLSLTQLVEKSSLGQGILLASSKIVKWNADSATEFDTAHGFENAQQIFGVYSNNLGFSG